MSTNITSTSTSTSTTSSTTPSSSPAPSSLPIPSSSSTTPTTSTTPASSTTLTSSSSSTTSGTSSTSTTSTSQSTTQPPSTSSSSSETPSTTTQVSTDAGGVVTTFVTVVGPTTSRPIANPTGVTGNGSSNSFFEHKGAVGGTFAAVGIVVLVIGIFIVTSILRKRRARKWDDEVSAAAAEAANHRMPVFLDDPEEKPYPSNDRGYNPNAGAPSGYGVGNYSDVSSHGTYGQSAMGHESQYPEMSAQGHGPGPGGIYDYNAAYAAGPVVGAGAAGIGVARTRSRGAGANLRDTPPAMPEHGAGMDDGYTAGLGEGGSPYPAFLAPGQGYEAYNNALNQGHQEDRSNAGTPGGTTRANAMASVAAAAAAGGSRPSASPPPANLARSNTSGESYASHYTPSGSPARPDAGQPSVENELPQPRAQSQEGLPNPFSSRIESDDESDGEEDVPGRRVLKVANE